MENAPRSSPLLDFRVPTAVCGGVAPRANTTRSRVTGGAGTPMLGPHPRHREHSDEPQVGARRVAPGAAAPAAMTFGDSFEWVTLQPGATDEKLYQCRHCHRVGLTRLPQPRCVGTTSEPHAPSPVDRVDQAAVDRVKRSELPVYR